MAQSFNFVNEWEIKVVVYQKVHTFTQYTCNDFYNVLKKYKALVYRHFMIHREVEKSSKSLKVLSPWKSFKISKIFQNLWNKWRYQPSYWYKDERHRKCTRLYIKQAIHHILCSRKMMNRILYVKTISFCILIWHIMA